MRYPHFRSIFAIVLLSAICFGATISPHLATSTHSVVDQIVSVSVQGGDMRSLAINISIPRQESYQSVSIPKSTVSDSEGNSYLYIYKSNPSNPFKYSESISVDTSARHTYSLPSDYTTGSDQSYYLSPTEKIQSDDPEIRQAALSIVAGAEDPYERIARLAIFVNSNMTYDDSMVGQEKDAKWVLQNMRGVCTEYSALFAALARSIGIPSRYISGYAQGDRTQTVVGHAWTEAYIGQWVPVDATWLEVGRLDALHLEVSKSADSESKGIFVAAEIPLSARLSTDTPGHGGAIADNVKFSDVQSDAQRSDYGLGAESTNLPFGGKTIAHLEINSSEYMVIPVSLVTCSGSERIMDVSNVDQYAILRPNRTTILSWEVSVSPSLSEGYLYTCPLTLNSPYLEPRAIELKATPKLDAPLQFTAQLSSPYSGPGAQSSAIITAPQGLAGTTFSLVTSTGISKLKIPGRSGEIKFFAQKSEGMQEIFVVSEKGIVVPLYLNVTRGGSSIQIDSFAAPSSVQEGSSLTATAEISATSYPADISLSFVPCSGKSSAYSSRISAPSSFNFTFTPSSAGACNLQLTASDSTSSGMGAYKVAAVDVLEGKKPVEIVQTPNSSQQQGSGTTPDQPSSCPIPSLAIALIAIVALFSKR